MVKAKEDREHAGGPPGHEVSGSVKVRVELTRAVDHRRREMLSAWASANGLPAAASADLLGLLAFYDEKLDEAAAKEATPASAPGEQPSAVSAMRECVFDDTLAPYAMTQMNEILAGDGATRLSAKLLKRLLSTRPPAPIDAFDEKKNAPSPSTTSKTLASTPVPAPPPLPPPLPPPHELPVLQMPMPGMVPVPMAVPLELIVGSYASNRQGTYEVTRVTESDTPLATST